MKPRVWFEKALYEVEGSKDSGGKMSSLLTVPHWEHRLVPKSGSLPRGVNELEAVAKRSIVRGPQQRLMAS